MAIDRTAILTDGYRNEGAFPSVAQIAAAVWDEPMSGHTTSGTFGNYIKSKLLTVAKFLALK